MVLGIRETTAGSNSASRQATAITKTTMRGQQKQRRRGLLAATATTVLILMSISASVTAQNYYGYGQTANTAVRRRKLLAIERQLRTAGGADGGDGEDDDEDKDHKSGLPSYKGKGPSASPPSTSTATSKGSSSSSKSSSGKKDYSKKSSKTIVHKKKKSSGSSKGQQVHKDNSLVKGLAGGEEEEKEYYTTTSSKGKGGQMSKLTKPSVPSKKGKGQIVIVPGEDEGTTEITFPDGSTTVTGEDQAGLTSVETDNSMVLKNVFSHGHV